jgi:hypothetical protein
MRTIPTILAAAAIAVGSTVPVANAAPLLPDCSSYLIGHQGTDPAWVKAYQECVATNEKIQQMPGWDPCYSTGVDASGNSCVPPD